MAVFADKFNRQLFSKAKRKSVAKPSSNSNVASDCICAQTTTLADLRHPFQDDYRKGRSRPDIQHRHSALASLEGHRKEGIRRIRSESGSRNGRCFVDGSSRNVEESGRQSVTSPLSLLVYRGKLRYLDSSQRWKNREVRCDGRVLVCLGTERVVLSGVAAPVKYLGRRPPKDIRGLELALAREHAKSAAEWRCSLADLISGEGGSSSQRQRLPDTPPINHPLFATPDENVVLADGNFTVRYIQDANWTLPITDITAVTRLARFSGERIKGGFAVHASNGRKYVFRATDEVEATLWIGFLIMSKARNVAEAAIPRLTSSLLRPNTVQRKRKTVSWNFSVAPEGKAGVFSANEDWGNTSTWHERRSQENSRPRRRDSLLNSAIFEEFNYQPPNEAGAQPIAMQFTRDSGYGDDTLVPNVVNGQRTTRFSAPPRFPEWHEGSPSLLPIMDVLSPPRPQPVPPLQIGSLLGASPRRTVKVSKIDKPVAHEAVLQFTLLPDLPELAGTDSQADMYIYTAESIGAASRPSFAQFGSSIPRELIADDVRGEIVSRAKYVLREIRCSSGFIPVPSTSGPLAIPDVDEDYPYSFNRYISAIPDRQHVASPTVKVSRIPVVVALEHLEDVVDGFISGDLDTPGYVGEADVREESRAKQVVRRLVAESMHRTHKDVMRLVGDGGNLADDSVFQTAIASVELLVVLFSAEGIRGVD